MPSVISVYFREETKISEMTAAEPTTEPDKLTATYKTSPIIETDVPAKHSQPQAVISNDDLNEKMRQKKNTMSIR